MENFTAAVLANPELAYFTFFAALILICAATIAGALVYEEINSPRRRLERGMRRRDRERSARHARYMKEMRARY